MKRIRHFCFVVALIWCFSLLFSCNPPSKQENNNDPEIKKIDLMLYAVTLHNYDSCSLIPNPDCPFKIVTYANLYCDPCWDYLIPWKEHYEYFANLPGVCFYCYVSATPEIFDRKNINQDIEFPVNLDTRERFRIVNKLGSDPNNLTFLLNQENEILLTGPPFTPSMRAKYLAYILE